MTSFYQSTELKELDGGERKSPENKKKKHDLNISNNNDNNNSRNDQTKNVSLIIVDATKEKSSFRLYCLNEKCFVCLHVCVYVLEFIIFICTLFTPIPRYSFNFIISISALAVHSMNRAYQSKSKQKPSFCYLPK